MVNRPDMIIKGKREKVLTVRCESTSGEEYHAKESRKGGKTQEFIYRDTTNVEHELCDHTGKNWGHRNSNKI
jgi:hypothetical protein